MDYEEHVRKEFGQYPVAPDVASSEARDEFVKHVGLLFSGLTDCEITNAHISFSRKLTEACTGGRIVRLIDTERMIVTVSVMYGAA